MDFAPFARPLEALLGRDTYCGGGESLSKLVLTRDDVLLPIMLRLCASGEATDMESCRCAVYQQITQCTDRSLVYG